MGKGFVLGLAEAGATFYVTGRTVGRGAGPWPGSLAETVEEATALGGRCIAVACDHAEDARVAGEMPAWIHAVVYASGIGVIAFGACAALLVALTRGQLGYQPAWAGLSRPAGTLALWPP